MFTPQDIRQIEEHRLSPEQIERQMERFRTGFPYLNLARAAVAGDGIVRMDASEAERCRALYRSRRDERRIVKFVPASGAATRMFKSLFGYLETGQAGPEVREVIERINRFAFADELHRLTGGSSSPRRLIEGIVRDGLGYGRLPKALILFHKYPEGSRTALEEHLAEGAMYAVGAGRSVHIHLTVSPEHMPLFERLVERVKPEYEARFGVRYDIGYSQQKPSTDTIAVNPDNTPFREGGRLLFRPAGHGALIENLNEIDADLVFVKTVDNVVPDRLKADTVASKETLGGLLLSLQEQAFEYLRETDGRVAPNCRVVADRPRTERADGPSYALQPRRRRMRPEKLPRTPLRFAAMDRSSDGIHLGEVAAGQTAAGHGATGPVERRDGAMEYRVRRSADIDLRPRQDRQRPAPAAAPERALTAREAVRQHSSAGCGPAPAYGETSRRKRRFRPVPTPKPVQSDQAPTSSGRPAAVSAASAGRTETP